MIWSFWQRLTSRTRQVREQAGWTDLVGADWPDWIMDVEADGDFHSKQGRSTCRWLPVGQAEQSVYLKRHYRLPWWLGILATLFPRRNWSPGFGEWQHLAWGHKFDIPVPQPRAAAQYIGPWGKLQSVLVIEELRGMLPLHQAIPLAEATLGKQDFAAWKRGLTREIARLARLLHGSSVYHKDLYLCHFYLAREDITEWPTRSRQSQSFVGKLSLIDFHRLGCQRLGGLWWQVKDLAQLQYSSELAPITPRDRLRFWRYYRGTQRRTLWHRLLESLVWLKWQRYRDHNQKRKRREQRQSETKVAA